MYGIYYGIMYSPLESGNAAIDQQNHSDGCADGEGSWTLYCECRGSAAPRNVLANIDAFLPEDRLNGEYENKFCYGGACNPICIETQYD
jgi:hypothetical protein